MSKIHRFITPFTINEKIVVIDAPDTVKQIVSVLKMKKGEKIILVDTTKFLDIEVALSELSKKEIKGNILKEHKNKATPKIEVILCAAILKKEHFELLVEKASEIGVTQIIPLITDRTIKKDIRIDRLEKIAKEATELAGLARVPEIHEPVSMKNAFAYTAPHDAVFFCDTEKEGISKPHSYKKAVIFVGPEGGWSEKEMEFATQNKMTFVSLGVTVFRGETAGIIASYKGVYGLL
ncbi:MAG: RsmE family RNA methyltransferase [bacterium]